MKRLARAVLAGWWIAVLAGCAGPSGPKAPEAAATTSALRGVEAVGLAADPPALLPLLRKALAEEGGPQVSAAGGGLPLLTLRAACGRDAQVKGEMPLRPFCMGWSEDTLGQVLTPSESFHPSCQAAVTLRRGEAVLYTRSDWAPCERPSDLQNLAVRIVHRFVREWKAARDAAGPP